MKVLRTEINIHASREKVWQILQDLDRWPDWNPFIHLALGKARVGEKVDISVVSPGTKDLVLHCVVTKVEPNHELRWKYHVISPLFFQGEHSFIIEADGESQVRFVDREVFNGLLVPLQTKDIDTNSRRGFESMDLALKEISERN